MQVKIVFILINLCASAEKHRIAIVLCVCVVLTNSIHNSPAINFRLYILLKFIQKIMYTGWVTESKNKNKGKKKESELEEQQQHQWQWQ